MRTPATTSSPCAFTRNSPLNLRSPVAASRVKATPVAEVSPMFPKTMHCTFTAVPHSSGILFRRRYSFARSFIQLSKTANIAPQSCSRASVGKVFPVCFCTVALKSVTKAFRSSTVKSVSEVMPRFAFCAFIMTSNGSSASLDSGFSPSTTSPYIWIKRR